MPPRTGPAWMIAVLLGAGALVPLALFSPHSAGAPNETHPTAREGFFTSPSLIPTPREPLAAHPGFLPAATVILPDGALSGASAPIVISGNDYDFTADYVGGIVDERNGSTVNGHGFNLTMDPSLTIGIEVLGASNVTIKNFLLMNTTTGILFQGGAGGLVSNNVITSTSWAVDLEYTSGPAVSNNIASGGIGVNVGHSTGVSIGHNQLPGTVGPGIEILYCTDVDVFSNNANGSSEGAVVEYSSSIHLIRNNFSSSFEGVIVYSVRDTVIVSNDFFASFYPLYLLYSTNTSGARNNGGGGVFGVYGYGDVGINLTTENFTNLSAAGISLSGVTDVSITNSSFTYSQGDGAVASGCEDLVLSNDDFSHYMTHGVSVTESTDVLLANNLVRFGNATPSYAFLTSHDSHLTLRGNTADHSYIGLQDSNSQDLNITGNDFSHSLPGFSTISLGQEAGVLVDQNNLFNASGNALVAFAVTGIVVTGNDLSAAGALALAVEYGVGATIANNSFDHSWFEELLVEQETQFTVRDNLGGHSGYSNAAGFLIYASTGGLVSNNSLRFLNQSMVVESSSDVTVVGNDVSDSSIGLVVLYNVGTQIVGNQVWNDTDGFEVGGNQDVWFYHNNFGNDSGWLNDSSLDATHWDSGYPGGGNFWSNFTGPDAFGGPNQDVPGADGIVDSPMVINATNVDAYPLAGSWTAHTASFHESGLIPGTTWGVVVAGSDLTSNGSTIVYTEPDAASIGYAYTVDPVPGFVASSYSGTTGPSSGDSTISVQFTVQRYIVSFQELGLINGTNWSVTLGVQTLGSSNGSLAFSVPNGTYAFSISPIADFALSPRAGTVVVSGDAADVSVSFAPVTYPITLVETGLGTASWGLSWAGSPHTSTGGSINFDVRNGSYAFIVNPVTGYNVTPASGEQVVNGTGIVLSIVFTLIPASPSPNPGPSKGTSASGTYPATTVYALLAALLVALALAVLGFLLLARARRPPPSAPTAWSPGRPAKSSSPTAAAGAEAWSEGPGDTAVAPPAWPTGPGGGPPPGAR